MQKSVLVTGASGTVGFEVVKQLIENNNLSITLFDKKSKASVKKLKPFFNQVEIVYGDISEKSDVLKVAGGKDFVIHLAAIIPPVADDFPEIANKVNFEGTKNLVAALEKNSPDCFFIYSSSISVYGDRLQNPLIKVTDEILPSFGDEYAKTKIAAEDALSHSKLDWTIFRLAAIMGGHKMSKLMFHQPLNTSLEIATPQDTARAFVNAIKHRNQLSKTIFNLGGGESCRTSYKDFLERSFEIFGLGELNFPQKSFAEKNFHCGFYEDGNVLDNILHFRQDSLDDYFKMESAKVSGMKKFGAKMFKGSIKKYLLKQSEPLDAIKTNNKEEIERYFN